MFGMNGACLQIIFNDRDALHDETVKYLKINYNYVENIMMQRYSFEHSVYEGCRV